MQSVVRPTYIRVWSAPPTSECGPPPLHQSAVRPPTSASILILFLNILLHNRTAEAEGRTNPRVRVKGEIHQLKKLLNRTLALRLLVMVFIKKGKKCVWVCVWVANISFCLVKHVIYSSLCVATGRKYICNYLHCHQVGLIEKPLAKKWMNAGIEGNIAAKTVKRKVEENATRSIISRY